MLVAWRSARIGIGLLSTIVALPAMGADVSGQVTVSDLTLVAKTRIGRTQFRYEYRITVQNSGGALTGVTATAASSSASTQIVDPFVTVGDLAAGEVLASTDTFELQQDRTVLFDPTHLTWSVDGSPSATGVLLPGAPNSLAVDAAFDRVGEPLDPGSIVGNLITTRLNGVIDPTATVGEVNTALSSVGGRITAMTAGGIVDIAIPAVANATAAQAVATQLESTGAFFAVTVEYFYPPIELLPPSMTPPPIIPEESYLNTIRAPSAWNIEPWLRVRAAPAGLPIPVRVADLFFNTTHRDLDISFIPSTGVSLGDDNHGWHVAGTIAARFDNLDATGVHPAPDLLDLKGVGILGGGAETWQNIMALHGFVWVEKVAGRPRKRV